MSWYNYTIGVPFGNPNYDVALGGSHDMTFLTPPNTEIFNIVSGTITDCSAPSWGKQVTLELDEPVNDHKYFAYLHLAAINPDLHVGQHIGPHDIIGWSGGCVQSSQYNGTHNPTGDNFLNSPNMSSFPQVGIALCDGPKYGGVGWKVFPPIDQSLNPMPVLDAFKKDFEGPPPEDFQREQFEMEFCLLVPGLDTHTGIANQAWEDYKQGKFRGPAIKPEVSFKDWNGNQIVGQWFLAGYYEWRNNTAQWYGFNSK